MDLNPLEDALGQPAEGKDRPVETPAPEPAVETQAPEAEAPAPEAPTNTESVQVPISALLDEREQRQAAQKALKDLQERQALLERQNAQAAPPEAQFQAALYAQNLRISRKFAEREYGPELIATVHDWAVARCDADPFFNAQLRSSDDPYGAAFQAYNREQIAAKVTPERLAAFEAWEQAQAELLGRQPPSPQTPAAPTPPRSLANAPGTGLAGHAALEVADGAAFAATIR